MKDYALSLASQQTTRGEKLNILREYLQAYMLRLAHDRDLFRHAAFIGGTALRFLYGLPRFSEDIDLSITHPKNFSFEALIEKIHRELILSGYHISVAWNAEKTVQRARVKFESLLRDAGISPLASEKLSIRIEMDSKPPQGAHYETHLVNRFFPIAFQTYDLSSLFSGKINALLARRYTKGRDFFDIGWYLSRWKSLEPNVPLLRNGLKQMGWKKDFPTAKNWRLFLEKIIEKADWKQVRLDVERFLERPSDLKVFTKENVLSLVQKKPG